MSIAHSIAKSAAIGLLLSTLAGAAQAKKPLDPIKINRSLSYFKESVGSTEIRRCPWNKNLIEAIAEEADGRVLITDESLSKAQGRTLFLTVMSVQANGSDRSNAANWIHLRGELKQGQSVVAIFTAKTEPVQTFSGRKRTACEMLDKISDGLIDQIAHWTKKPANAELGYTGTL